MKSFFIKLIAGSAFLLTVFAVQAAPPTLMVLPDKTWCVQNNFVNRVQKQGKTRIIEQFEEAFVGSTDLKNVKTTINKLFSKFGFPLVDAEASLSGVDEEEDEEEFMESEEGGAEIKRTPYDQLMNKCKPDITLRVGWEVNPMGFKESITYRLEAIDSYSNKSVAVASGTGTPENAPLAVLLERAIIDKMPEFTQQLLAYFDDIQTNGREISLRVRVWDNAGFSLTKDLSNGKELGEEIYQWLSDNTINHQFTEGNTTPNRATYTQVRIPLHDSMGRPLQARQFVKQLQNHLSRFGIQSANRTAALGSGVIALGSK